MKKQGPRTRSTTRIISWLLTLALAAGLFLLCRLLERGLALQRDSDSII